MPAEAGIQNELKKLDSRLRGNDAKWCFEAFYGFINIKTPIELLVYQNISRPISE